jgi:tetratricopeptide (TPR) repeat protein
MPAEPAKSASASQEPVADMDWLDGLTAAAAASTSQQNVSPVSHGDMPDWLSGSDDNNSQTSSNIQTEDTPDWLSGLGGGEAQSSSIAAETPDWLSGGSEAQPASAATQDSGIPDWMSGLGSTDSQPSASSSDVPDWLAGLDNSQPAAPQASQDTNTPDWLAGLGSAETFDATPAAKTETPDWLGGFDEQVSNEPAANANIETLGATAQEQDDAVAWLESLAAKHGAKPEELVTDPRKRSETAPEWVQQATVANEAQPASQTPATIESLGASAQEQDDAVAWLESLAAKHGAKPEELVTDPSKRSDTAPDWVQQASAIGESQPDKAGEPAEVQWSENAQNIGEQFFAEFENASTAESANDETGVWLKSLDQNETQDAEPLKEGNVPDWLSAGQSSMPSATNDEPVWLGEKSASEQDYISENLSQDDLSNWLSNLDDSADAQLVSQSVSSGKQDLPDWLSSVDAKSETKDQPMMEAQPASEPAEELESAKATSDLPDWLKGVDEEAGINQDEEGEDTPPWLHRESWEAEERTIEPTPIKSSDWHPIAPVEKELPKEEVKPVQVKQEAVVQVKLQQAPKVQPKKQFVKAEPAGVSAILTQAKGELDRGDIPTALDHYGKLIKKGKNLEETIRDLTDSLYRYPVEVGIWQTLGDAYMRANRLKEALEAYNKAEELIR